MCKMFMYPLTPRAFAVMPPRKRNLKIEPEPGSLDPRQPTLNKHLVLLMTVRGKLVTESIFCFFKWFHEPSRWQVLSLVNKCKTKWLPSLKQSLPRHHDWARVGWGVRQRQVWCGHMQVWCDHQKPRNSHKNKLDKKQHSVLNTC